MAASLYEERFTSRYLPGRRMFTSLHQRLPNTGILSANRIAAGSPMRIRAETEGKLLHHFRENPRISI